MARARNIKPGLFANEVLAECEPLARILFTGLWTIADREGRLEDRPKRIKAEILPYDECDCDRLLSQLALRGFIVRYTAGGIQYLQVLNFTKHQNPHVKEAASIIPAPCEPGASTGPAGEKPEGAGPLTDSPLLIPDPPLPHQAASQADGEPKSNDAPPDGDADDKRGKRLLAYLKGGTEITEEFLFEATARGFGLDATKLVWTEFIDYWRGVPGQKGVKLDWPATWRNALKTIYAGRENATSRRNATNYQPTKSKLQLAVEATERARALRESRGPGPA